MMRGKVRGVLLPAEFNAVDFFLEHEFRCGLLGFVVSDDDLGFWSARVFAATYQNVNVTSKEHLNYSNSSSQFYCNNNYFV